MSTYAAIVATNQGSVVTQTGNDLTLYGPDLKLLKRLKLPPLSEYDWAAHPSFTGKNILFVSSELSGNSWIWVETDTLDVVRSWNEERSGNVAISDNELVMVKCQWAYSCEPQLEVRSVSAKTWKTIGTAQARSFPQFVSHGSLFLAGDPSKLVRTDGQVVFAEGGPPKGCWWGRVFSSAGGERFIVPVCRTAGKNTTFDIGGQEVLEKLVIYDASLNWRPYELSIGGRKIKGLTELALSPDGRRVALMNGETVELLNLPPLQ
jgi:hypothetical protein